MNDKAGEPPKDIRGMQVALAVCVVVLCYMMPFFAWLSCGWEDAQRRLPFYGVEGGRIRDYAAYALYYGMISLPPVLVAFVAVVAARPR